MNIEERLNSMNLNLPVLSDETNNAMSFSMGSMSNNLIFLSGQLPMIGEELKYNGTVGSTVTKDEAKDAARLCTLNLLAVLKHLVGNLDKVNKIVKVNGYVASEKAFIDQTEVIDVASDLLNKIFKKQDKHSRVAIGVAALPLGAPVEIEMIVEIDNKK